jgi:hypothetical protein
MPGCECAKAHTNMGTRTGIPTPSAAPICTLLTRAHQLVEAWAPRSDRNHKPEVTTVAEA